MLLLVYQRVLLNTYNTYPNATIACYYETSNITHTVLDEQYPCSHDSSIQLLNTRNESGIQVI